MTKEEYMKEMKDAVMMSKGDPEMVHYHADSILTNLLCDLGYSDLVEEFLKVEKWYS